MSMMHCRAVDVDQRPFVDLNRRRFISCCRLPLPPQLCPLLHYTQSKTDDTQFRNRRPKPASETTALNFQLINQSQCTFLERVFNQLLRGSCYCTNPIQIRNYTFQNYYLTYTIMLARSQHSLPHGRWTIIKKGND